MIFPPNAETPIAEIIEHFKAIQADNPAATIFVGKLVEYSSGFTCQSFVVIHNDELQGSIRRHPAGKQRPAQ